MSETARTYETTIEKEYLTFLKSEAVATAKGEALFEQNGMAVPFSKDANFAGFVEGHYSNGNVCAIVRGSIVLKIPGSSDKDRGKPVYAGENHFSFNPKDGPLIGKVRHCEDERCAIAFRRPDDTRPLNLDV